MLPLILNQLGAENLNSLKKIATAVSGGNIIIVHNFVRFLYYIQCNVTTQLGILLVFVGK